VSIDHVERTVPTLDEARALDKADGLAGLRERFDLPDGLRYFDGNSLGALPAAVTKTLHEVVGREWREGLIRSWFEGGWWDGPVRVGDRIAPLLGAAPGQVVVGDSVSVQLFNLLVGAVRLRSGRRRVLIDAAVFPSDRYIAESVVRMLDMELVPVAMEDVAEELERAGDDVAVALGSPVDFRTGRVWDIPGVTRAARAAGAVSLWDLCHAAGAMPVDLDEHGVDLAVGCTYKFLSGGPGSPAFVYIAERHQATLDLPLTGWHGHAKPFAFDTDYRPDPGAARARVGTPHILSLRAFEGALSAFDGVDIADVRAKSVELGRFFLRCLDALPREFGLVTPTPREDHLRGSQVTVLHPRSEALLRELEDHGVICDHRPPDMLRFGYNALYVTFEDVLTAVAALGIAAERLR
jgi:kynureninase